MEVSFPSAASYPRYVYLEYHSASLRLNSQLNPEIKITGEVTATFAAKHPPLASPVEEKRIRQPDGP